jgi:hypothetical protein
MFEQLIYVSRAAPGVGSPEAYDIIRTAHNRNSRGGLTGALILLDGHFAQVLEGDPYHLRERFEVIRRDPRHRAVDVRGLRHLPQRSFPDEWMALRHGDAVAPSLRAAHGYVPGFPPDRFPAERLLAFVRACCEAATASA